MAIIWFTGQPGSGKTTLAKRLLVLSDPNTFHIDGDDLRQLFNNKDYTSVGREQNIRLAQQISEYLYTQKKHVIVSLVSPYREQREEFKKKIGDDQFLEIWTHTTESRGKKHFHVKEYEEPTTNYLDLDTGNFTTDECIEIILSELKSRNIL